MKIAFIGDVHGYLPALLLALEICDAEEVETIVGLGDYIDGGQDNERCLALIRERCDIAVVGNHDQSHAYTMPATDVEWIHNLPEFATLDNWTITHSSPRKLGEKVNSDLVAWSCFEESSFIHCVVGHSHCGKLFEYNHDFGVGCRVIDYLAEPHVLKPNRRYLLANPSLAYNRYGDRRPAFSIFDGVTRELKKIQLNLPACNDH